MGNNKITDNQGEISIYNKSKTFVAKQLSVFFASCRTFKILIKKKSILYIVAVITGKQKYVLSSLFTLLSISWTPFLPTQECVETM